MGRRRTPTTDEGRENQLISYAYDLAEKQLREGTASSQVMTHFLKAGSTRDRIERAKLERENELLVAKVEALNSAQDTRTLMLEALKAMRGYAGLDTDPEEDPTYYYEEEYDEWD